MPSTLHTDVLIAGGGPCGLMLANELGRRGVRCLLVDQKPSTAFNPQANAPAGPPWSTSGGFRHTHPGAGLPGDHPTDILPTSQFCRAQKYCLRLPTAKRSRRSHQVA